MNIRCALTVAALCVFAFSATASEIHDAVGDNNLVRVKELLAKNPELANAFDERRGAPPLQFATSKEMAELLLANKANVNATRASDGRTALFSAANAVSSYVLRKIGSEIKAEDRDQMEQLHGHGNAELTEFLLAHGADVDQADHDGMTALLIAGDRATAEALLAHGAALQARDKKGRSALHSATSADMAEFFLANKFDVNSRDNDGLTPLHTCWDASIAMVLIKHHADVNAKSKTGRTPIFYQAGETGVQIAKLLIANDARLNLADDKGITPLKAALERGEFDVAQVLAANHATVDVFAAATLGLSQQLEDLLKADRALANARDKTQRTPLHWAALREHADAAALLLKFNAEVDARDQDGRTPLICAGRSKPELAKLLLEHKADIDAFDHEGRCVLQEAMSSKYGREELDLLESFRRKGSNELVDAISRKDAAKVQSLLDGDPQLVRIRDHSAATPLHWAAVKGSPEIARILIQYRADVNAVSFDEGTPLLDAALLHDKAMADLLIENGARVDIFAAAALGLKDKLKELLKADPSLAWLAMSEGETALHLAARTGELGSIDILLSEKANINTLDHSGHTPLDYAIAAHQKEAAQALMTHQAKPGKSE